MGHEVVHDALSGSKLSSVLRWHLGGETSSTDFEATPGDRGRMQKGSKVSAHSVTFMLADIQGTLNVR